MLRSPIFAAPRRTTATATATTDTVATADTVDDTSKDSDENDGDNDNSNDNGPPSSESISTLLHTKCIAELAPIPPGKLTCSKTCSYTYPNLRT